MELPEDRNHEIWTPSFALEDHAVAFVSFFELEEKRLLGLAEKRALLRGLRPYIGKTYGPAGLARMPRIEAIEDNALLERLFVAAETGVSLEEITAMLP